MPDAGQVRSDPDSRQAPETAVPAEGAGREAQAQPGAGTSQLTAEQAEDRWRRAVADLDNVRKRAVRELSEARERERASVATQFLPVLDNLELALAHSDGTPGAIMDGVRAVRDQAVAVLARLGYERLDASGVPFDPTTHEVVSVVDDPDAEPGTVVRVMRPGYGRAERQLRPAGVAVARHKE
ncbi:MAG: molecular chaperone GrpE [Frankiales bacterium]|nr:molecular chaperone GrpE [Frankiales bacterium]